MTLVKKDVVHPSHFSSFMFQTETRGRDVTLNDEIQKWIHKCISRTPLACEICVNRLKKIGLTEIKNKEEQIF